MDQIEKFLRKINKKLALKIALILKDIGLLKLSPYDLEKMKGFENLYRIRVGKIRIVFQNLKTHGHVVYIEYRGQAYKKF